MKRIFSLVFVLTIIIAQEFQSFAQHSSEIKNGNALLKKAELCSNPEVKINIYLSAAKLFDKENDIEGSLFANLRALQQEYNNIVFSKEKSFQNLSLKLNNLHEKSQKELGVNNVLEAEILLSKAWVSSHDPKKRNEVEKLLDKSLNIFLKKGNTNYFPNGFSEARNYSYMLGWIWHTKGVNSAIEYGKSKFSYLKNKYENDYVGLGYLSGNLGIVLLEAKQFESALQYFEVQKRVMSKYPRFDYVYKNNFENIGRLYDELGNYDKAIEFFENALIRKKKIYDSNHIQILKSYNRIGGVYQELGKYKEAINYYKKALEGIVILRGENNSGAASFYNNIGECLHLQGNYDLALESHIKALDIRLKSIGKEAPYTSNSYHNIGKAYLGKNQFDSAKYYLNNGMSLRIKLDKKRTDMKRYVADSYNNMGLVNIKLNNYSVALDFFYKALNEYIKLYGKQHPEVAATYNHIGDVNSLQNKIDLSLISYHNAIIANTIDFNNRSLDALPKADDYVKPYIMLTSLDAKANILERNYYKKKKDEIKYLIQAYHTYKLCVDFLSLSRKNQYYQTDKLNLMKKSRRIYEGGIRVCYDLYQITNEKKYIKEAFFFSEKSKATILSDKTIEESAKLFSDIPDSLLVKEEELNSTIASYEVRLQREKLNKNSNKQKIKVFKDSLFELKRREGKLINFFELKYPKYHELKYNKPIATIEKVQASLNRNATLIEYFIANGGTYVFLIEKNKFLIKKIINTNQTANRIKLLSESVKGHDFENYTKHSYDIYSKIFQPIKNDITGKKLIIIPDGSLWYLNFDILLTQKEKYQKYSNLPYLIKDYIISYAYTADLLYQEKTINSNKAINECLAFSYSNDGAEINNSLQSDSEEIISMNTLRNSSLDDLPGTRKEIADISNLMEGKYYYGYSANEKNFKEVAQNYAVLHLALHGEVNDKDPLQSKLFFTKNKNDSIEDDFLYAYELYNMELNADLAVLSACNTGVGELEGGEGVMSLGRAFIYAGCKSLLMSQWEISDWSTSGIMKSFYTYLSDGKPKDEALYYAKLDYLKNSDNISADPAYWAPLVFLGDNSPQIESEINYSYLIVLLLAVSFVLVFFKLKKM